MKPTSYDFLKRFCRFYMFAGITIIIIGAANWVIGLVSQNMSLNAFGTVVVIDIFSLLGVITMGLVVLGIGQLAEAMLDLIVKSRENHAMLTTLLEQKKDNPSQSS